MINDNLQEVFRTSRKSLPELIHVVDTAPEIVGLTEKDNHYVVVLDL